MSNTMLEVARSYVAAGLSVIPIEPVRGDRNKEPAVESWKPYQARLPNDDELTEWFDGTPNGIAVIGGKVSGNLEQLDFDVPGLLCDFLDVCRATGLMPYLQQVAWVRTPKGGDHLYYRCDTPPKGNKKLAYTVSPGTENGTKCIKVGADWYRVDIAIETRGEGGYTVAPPSGPHIHPLKKPYVLKRGDFTRLPVFSGQVREALHAIAQTFGQPLPAVAPKPKREQLKADRPEGLTPWDDFDRRGDPRPSLERAGWTFVNHRSDGAEVWCRPGKKGAVSATYDFCTSDGIPLFYVFSSNAAPFVADSPGYGPSRIVQLLDYAGDASAMARGLAAKGYGHR